MEIEKLKLELEAINKDIERITKQPLKEQKHLTKSINRKIEKIIEELK